MKETVLITGGTGGIGSACARRFAADGYPVAILFHTDAAAATRLVADMRTAGGKAEAFQCDVADAARMKEIVAQAAERLGPIRTVIHAATAPLLAAPVQDASWESYQQHLDVTLHGAVNVVQATVPGMVEMKRGHFFFFFTEAMEQTVSGWSAYVAAKGALLQYAHSIEHELNRSGIVVETIVPGFVDTPLTAELPDVFKRLARTQAGATTPEALADRIAQRMATIQH